MKHKTKVITGLALVLSTVFGLGISARTVNMADLVSSADRIFRGRCLSVKQVEPIQGFAVNEYSFEVIEGFKGVSPGDSIVFRQVSGKSGFGRGVAGMSGHKAGSDIVLFLYPDSRLGLTSPVGFDQGVFKVMATEDGRTRVMNSLENRNLGHELTTQQTQAMGFDAQQARNLKQVGPMDLETFRGAVERIDREFQGKSIQ
jgi:hypothetical protein